MSAEWESRELSEANVAAYLDDAIKQALPWIDHWIDRGIETGWNKNDILALIARWSDKSQKIRSLELLASAIIHIGERDSLELMNATKIAAAQEVEAIRSDTTYAVKRRTLADSTT